MTKQLWHYDNATLFEVETFHHCPAQYKSWKEFVNDKEALSCNCICDNPLLYWYWDNNDDDPEEWYEFSKKEKNFKRIIFIYRSWFSGRAAIKITVTPKDEPEIREFIFKQQQNQCVSL